MISCTICIDFSVDVEREREREIKKEDWRERKDKREDLRERKRVMGEERKLEGIYIYII